MIDLTLLKQKAAQARIDSLKMVFTSKDGHIPSALSLVELLVVLYNKILIVDPANTKNPSRDRFILSKGHGCVSLYSVLADLGFFPKEELEKFCTFEGILGGHPDAQKIPGIEVSTGSLGQGLSVAVGLAQAGKIRNSLHRVFCVVGDGECNEGSVWEAVQVAAHQKLDNLIVILDLNGHQSSGRAEQVCNPFNMKEKWKAFGWEVVEIDGHNFIEIMGSLSLVPFKREKPSVIIAHTIKGKGVSFMEDQTMWHTMIPSEEEYQKAIKEISDNFYKEV